MRILFSKNNRIGSKLIRWGSESDSSHFAVEFDGCVILQSNIANGVNLTSTNEFLKHNEIVHEVVFNIPTAMEEEIWQPLIKRLPGVVQYDYSGLLYWAWVVAKHRLFNTPIPDVNKWGDPKKYMCVEVASELPDWVFGNKKPTSLEFVSPEKLFHLIDERTKDADIRAY